MFFRALGFGWRLEGKEVLMFEEEYWDIKMGFIGLLRSEGYHSLLFFVVRS